jgi:hypothetical protein
MGLSSTYDNVRESYMEEVVFWYSYPGFPTTKELINNLGGGLKIWYFKI